MTTELAPERNVSGWLRQPLDSRDFPAMAYRPDIFAAPVPESFDLRGPHQPPIQNQGSLGSCVAWACTRAYRYVQRKMGLPDQDFSELATYYWARSYQGWTLQDSGAYLRDGIKALAEFGASEESFWPYDISRYREEPSAQSLANASEHQATRYLAVQNQQEQIKAVVASGYAIVFGIPIYQNFPQGNGVWDIPTPQGQVIGGHAMTVIGYDLGGVLLANSWGSNWGVNGFARMPWAYFLSQASDLWMIETVEGESPAPPPPLGKKYLAWVSRGFNTGEIWSSLYVPPADGGTLDVLPTSPALSEDLEFLDATKWHMDYVLPPGG